MKVLFFISTVKGRNSGNGGHYRSLLSYYSQLKKVTKKVAIMHYNEMDHSILDDKADNLLNGIRGTNIYGKKADEILKSREWNAVISFGESLQSRMLRYYCWRYDTKFIQVIAGGPNRFLPLNFINCIYYSKENITNRRDFTPNQFLLTNRIDQYSVNDQLIKDLESAYPKKEFNVLRVSRICHAYLETFVSAINLHKLLKKNKINVQTHLVGHLQEKDVYDILKEKIKGLEDIFIITEAKFTNDAKNVMSYYNLAVAIGRGFGEAASKNLLVLGYNSTSEVPIVINEENYEMLRGANFSPRTAMSQKFDINNYLQLFSTDSVLRKIYRDFTYKKFEEDYASSRLPSRLLEIIGKSKMEELVPIVISMFFISLSEIGHRLNYYFKKRGFSFDFKKILNLK